MDEPIPFIVCYFGHQFSPTLGLGRNSEKASRRVVKMRREVLFQILIIRLFCFYSNWRHGYRAYTSPRFGIVLLWELGVHTLPIKLDEVNTSIPAAYVVNWMENISGDAYGSTFRNSVRCNLYMHDSYFYWINHPRGDTPLHPIRIVFDKGNVYTFDFFKKYPLPSFKYRIKPNTVAAAAVEALPSDSNYIKSTSRHGEKKGIANHSPGSSNALRSVAASRIPTAVPNPAPLSHPTKIPPLLAPA